MRALMDEVHFEQGGTEVHMRKGATGGGRDRHWNAVGVVSKMRMWRDLIDEAASHSRATLPNSNRFSFPSVHGSTVTNARTSRLPQRQ
jgi:hypothetical protein